MWDFKMKSKIFLLMFCMILLVGTISAFEIDNWKNYDSEKREVVVKREQQEKILKDRGVNFSDKDKELALISKILNSNPKQ